MSKIDEVFHPEETSGPATDFFGTIAKAILLAFVVIFLLINAGLLDWARL
jgi:hypothetical protein